MSLTCQLDNCNTKQSKNIIRFKKSYDHNIRKKMQAKFDEN